MGGQVIDLRGLFDEQGNPIVKRKKAVERLVEVEKPAPAVEEKTKVITVEKPVYVPVEKRKLKQAFDFSPEESLTRLGTFSPSYSFDYAFAPEEFSATSQIFSPSESYDVTFAPKRSAIKRSVYSPSTVLKNKFAPKVERKIAFKPRLFDKLLAIFAPEAILKQKAELAFKPYDYQYTQTAIIDAYNPEQITSVEKFAPKDESNFNLRIAPETEFTIKISPPTPMFFSSVYIDLLKKIIR